MFKWKKIQLINIGSSKFFTERKGEGVISYVPLYIFSKHILAQYKDENISFLVKKKYYLIE